MKKILMLIFFTLVTMNLFAFKIDSENYRSFIGKHFIFMPKGYSYKIGDKEFDREKYSGKSLLIKDISFDSGEFVLILEETTEKGKTKDIKIKFLSSVYKSVSNSGVWIEEEMQEAKDFFLGKTLYATSPYSDIKNINAKSYSNGKRAEKETPYKIVDVVWGNDSWPFYLMIGNDSYIPSMKSNETPHDFTTNAPKKEGAEKYNIERGEDKLDGIKWVTVGNNLKVEGKDSIQASIYKYTTSDKKESLSIQVLYYSESWLFIRSARLYIDGVAKQLVIGKVSRDVIYAGTISEGFDFQTTKEQLSQIIQAKSVTLRLVGDKGYVDGEFAGQDFYNFKRFYDEEIK